MDNIIANYNYISRNGLNVCIDKGIAYQTDMTKSVMYGKDYYYKYVKYENTDIGKKLNAYRLEFVKKWQSKGSILDIGVGSGTFLKAASKYYVNASGYDINPYSILWLNNNNMYFDIYKYDINFNTITFWDSLEHIKDPQIILDKIKIGTRIFISLPIFDDINNVKASKHYRPNEHYYYFDNNGLIKWLRRHSFKLITCSNLEIRAGREDIKTYLFEKTILSKTELDRLKGYEDWYKKEKDNINKDADLILNNKKAT